MNSGIYKIVNKIDGKIYVGQSIHLEKRKNEHFKELINNKHQNQHLQYAFNKYGINNFDFIVIEYCDKNVLDDREIYYINLYNSLDDNFGYNIREGGKSGTFTDETREKLMKKKMFIPENTVFNIKNDLANGISRVDVRKKYGITQAAVDSIAKVQKYKYINADVNERLISISNRNNTDRNKKILQLLNQGYTNKEICDKLHLSVSIVEKVKYANKKFVDDKNNLRKKIYDNVQRYKEEGLNPMSISKILGISYDIAYNYYHNKNNPYKKLSCKKMDKDIEDKIISLSRQYNFTQISKIVGLSRFTVTNIIKNYKNANTEITE